MQDAPGREGAHGPRGPAPALLRLAQRAPGHLVLSAQARRRLRSGVFRPWLLYLHLRYAETSVLNDTPILNVTCES